MVSWQTLFSDLLTNESYIPVRCVSTALDSLTQPLDFCIARIRRHPKKVAPRQIQSSADTEYSKGEWLAALSADQTLSEPVRQRVLQFAREWK